jgi:hypothetical protein
LVYEGVRLAALLGIYKGVKKINGFFNCQSKDYLLLL